MKTNAEGIALIKRCEGLRLEAYPDPASPDGTPWTIGYGHTEGVRKGDRITAAEAERFLEVDLRKRELGVAALTAGVPLTDNQFSALVSFAYNVGLEALRTSKLLRYLRERQTKRAAAQFEKWIYASGKPRDYLVSRRKAERALFEKETP